MRHGGLLVSLNAIIAWRIIMSQRILVIDDEENVLKLVEYTMKKEGYQVTTVTDGNSALVEVGKGCDFIILDVMLPDMDGFEILKRIRRNNTVPVLMLTARAEEIDRILGLEFGADDYLTKPFSPRELVARVKAILRRTGEKEQPEISTDNDILIGTIRIIPSKRRVEVSNKEIALTFKEFELLLLLIKHPGRVFSREELLERVWGYDYYGDSRTIDVHMRHLREKIEIDSTIPNYLKTVRGVGYKFDI